MIDSRQIVVVCVGSSKISGDSLGPLVGSMLRERGCPFFVYGVWDCSVNGRNLPEFLTVIKLRHHNSIIIGVDAAVGDKSEIGAIKLKRKGIAAGGALNKNLPVVGDIGVVAVVAEKSDNTLASLIEVPFAFVEALARRTADKIMRLSDKLDAYMSTKALY